MTYVGHSIIAYGDVPVVRRETNTVNLDVATFQNPVSLVAIHTIGVCQLPGPGAEETLSLVDMENLIKCDNCKWYMKGKLI